MASQPKSLAPLLLLVAAAAAAAPFAAGFLAGGKQPLTPQDVQSAEFRGVLDAATLEMNRLSGHPRFHAMLAFQQGTKQVVAGMLYEFSMVLRATNCENHEAQNLENLAKCSPVNLLGASEFHCTFKVLHQPWNTNSEYQVVEEPACVSPREVPGVPFGRR